MPRQDPPSRNDAALRAVGAELAAARRRLGLHVKDLEATLDPPMAYRTILTYEHGTRQWPLDRFIQLCHALGIHPVELLDRALRRLDLATTCPHCGSASSGSSNTGGNEGGVRG